MKNYLCLAAVCCISLTGCSSSSSNPDSSEGAADSGTNATDSVLTGVFLDSAVEGASYTTETQSGVSNSSGEFSYLQGENVTFSIGSLVFPTIPAAEQVSPVDMASSASDPAATSTNIARLLQSLDRDGNPDNGITISADAVVRASQLNFDVSSTEFENNAEVINLVANSGSVTSTLISADQAVTHLNTTLGITGNNENEPDANILLTNSPWYSIFERPNVVNSECGNKYTFGADGFVTVVFQRFESNEFETATVTYTLTTTGFLLGENDSYQLDLLNAEEWTANKVNNDGNSYVERAFSSRTAALNFANELGKDCDSGLSQ